MISPLRKQIVKYAAIGTLALTVAITSVSSLSGCKSSPRTLQNDEAVYCNLGGRDNGFMVRERRGYEYQFEGHHNGATIVNGRIVVGQRLGACIYTHIMEEGEPVHTFDKVIYPWQVKYIDDNIIVYRMHYYESLLEMTLDRDTGVQKEKFIAMTTMQMYEHYEKFNCNNL